jgi:hypothetical protein
MRLLRHSELKTSSEDRVFRSSPVRATLVALALAGIGAALVLVDWEGRSASAHHVAYYIAGLIFLSLVLMRRFVLARFRPSNWLVRMSHDGLFIHFRSYLNDHFSAEDPTVVFIAYQDIRSARLVRERTTIPDAEGAAVVHARRLVVLELTGDLEPLSKALAAELARTPPQEKTWYGHTSTLYGHYPVRIVSPPFLQMEWTVVPSASRFLDALRPYTTIAPPDAVPEDFTNLGGLSRQQQEERLRELDQRGQTMAAIQIARRLYGCDLTEAQALVKGLRAKQ